MHWASISAEVKGYPFLDPTFDQRAFISIVAMIRWTRGGRAGTMDDYLRPDVAYTVYAPAHGFTEPFIQERLSASRLARVDEARDAIVAARPDWAALFQIGVEFGRTSHLVSSMHPAYPQQVLLGDGAFDTEDRLRETLVHEMSHVWYGLMGEMAPFQLPGESPVHTLPSGTPGRDTRSVVTAAFFAACVLGYFRGVPAHNEYVAVRRPYLRRYLRGCCDILAAAPNLSDSGLAALDRLDAYAREEQAAVAVRA